MDNKYVGRTDYVCIGSVTRSIKHSMSLRLRTEIGKKRKEKKKKKEKEKKQNKKRKTASFVGLPLGQGRINWWNLKNANEMLSDV